MACEMSVIAEPVGTIKRRLETKGILFDMNELRALLDGLYSKGAITGEPVKSGSTGAMGYSLMPIVIGMFEMQVDRLTPEYTRDFEEYLHGDLRDVLLNGRTGQVRTVPVGAAVESTREVGTYDDIKAYVRSARGPFAVMNCVCRQAKDLLDDPCDHGDLRETCLTIGDAAIHMNRRGNARIVERDEFLGFLDRAERKGFVVQPQNNRNPEFICCCCGDCCEILTSAKKIPRPADFFHTNYHAENDGATCTGCATCVDRCPMEALAMEDAGRAGAAVVDRDRCIGCGLCVSSCPTGSLDLVKKSRAAIPPKNSRAMYTKIYRERLGAWGAAKVLVKALFKRQV